MADQEILVGPEETAEDSGTLGLNIYGNVGGNVQTVLSYTATGQVPDSLAWLTGNFTGTENMGIQIAQPWDNNGTLEMIVYGIGNDGTLETVYASPMHQGSSALAFLTGNFISSGPTQIAQTRDNNGALQLLIYGNVGDGGLSTVFSNDISQIPFALAWVTGDFTGTGNTQILQPWMRVFG